MRTKETILWSYRVLTVAILASRAAVAADDTAGASAGLAEVTVTAQRRVEGSQSVPISVAAFGVEDLQTLRATSTDDLPLMVPGMTMQPTAASAPIFLRGVGNNNASNVGSAVLIFIDGVYYPYQSGNLPFNNVASVEVDKGPQGTLFGRNATGGVIQITTRDPQFTPSGSIDVGYGNYDTTTVNAYATTGLTDKLAADVAVYYLNQKDGWGRNVATGGEVFTEKNVALRSKWLYRVNDDTSMRLTWDYLTSEGSVGTDVRPAVGRGFLFNEISGETFTIPGKYDVNSNYPPSAPVRQMGASLRLDTRLGDLRAVSITSWRMMRSSFFIDYDGTPLDFFDVFIFNQRQAQTQEFQLLSPDDSKISWVGGLYFYNDVGKQDPFSFGGPAGSIVFRAPEGQAFDIFSHDRVTSYAAFGQATLPVAPDTNLTLGARYTDDQRYLNGYTVAGNIVPGSAGSQSTEFRRPTYRLILDHKLAADAMLYASYNKGFNSGYFNQVATRGFTEAANPAVKPEIIDAYEVGTKTEWLDHRLRLNASLFWYDYKNLQQQVYEGAALVTVNAAAARFKGIDLDVEARPIAALTLAAGLELLDAKFTTYHNAPIYSTGVNGALLSSPGDASGNYIPYAPRVGYNVRGSYDVPTSIGDFATTATLTYTGPWYADPGDYYQERAHTLVNVSETWTSVDGHFKASLWAKNLGQTHYDAGINMLAPIAPVGNPGAPRTYGITVGYKF